VDVYGGFAGTEIALSESALTQRNWTANLTILSGDVDGNNTLDAGNSYHVVKGANSTVIDGFTIQQGYANGAGNDVGGGGMLNLDVSPTVSHCVFKNNAAKFGGAVCSLSSTTSIRNSLFAFNGVVVNSGAGGAIYYENEENGLIENCTIANNSATVIGGISGAICCNVSSDLTVKNSIIWGNQDSYGPDDIDAFGSSAVSLNYTDLGYIYPESGSSITIDSPCMSVDPLFASSNDFHLKSVGGRWTNSGFVYTDAVTSPCINAGDPSSAYASELSPNGSRINMGAYGNTDQASKSSLYPLIIYMTTDDQAALPSDAKWYIVGQSGTKYSSGQAAMVPAGSCTIRFEVNSGTPYIQPSDMTKTITSSSANSYSATYKAAGVINYLCYYYDDNGNYSTNENKVGWKVSSESLYHNGEKKYVPGTYTVQFQTLDEHATPANTQRTVTKGSNYSSSKEYLRTKFYVDADDGNDDNRGGSQNRFLTIQKALDMMPNDSITLTARYIFLYDDNLEVFQNVTFPSNKSLQLKTGMGESSIWVYGSNNAKPQNIQLSGVYFD